MVKSAAKTNPLIGENSPKWKYIFSGDGGTRAYILKIYCYVNANICAGDAVFIVFLSFSLLFLVSMRNRWRGDVCVSVFSLFLLFHFITRIFYVAFLLVSAHFALFLYLFIYFNLLSLQKNKDKRSRYLHTHTHANYTKRPCSSRYYFITVIIWKIYSTYIWPRRLVAHTTTVTIV